MVKFKLSTVFTLVLPGGGISLICLDDFQSKTEGWLTFMRSNKNRSSSTCAKYADYLDRLGSYCVGNDVDPLYAPPAVLSDFCGMYLHTQGLSPSARRPVISCIRGFYGWLQKNRYVTSNAALDLVYPSKSRKVPIAMQLFNVEKLLMQPDIAELSGARDAAMIALCAGTGIRVGGLVSLNESNLIIYHDGSAKRLGIKVREKGDHERVVPVPREAEMFLYQYLSHDELENIDRTIKNGDKVLFVSLKNRTVKPCDYIGEKRRISSRSVLRAMQKHARNAGIPLDQAHPHALRHLLGTEMAESEIDLLVIQSQLGHVDADSTKIYAHLALRKRTELLDRSNPLGKIKTLVSPMIETIEAAQNA